MKKVILFGLLISLLVLASCQQDTNNSQAQTVSFIGGNDALKLSFVPGAPPDDVLDNDRSSFNVNVEVKNVGESEVKMNNLKVSLSGINPDDFGKTPEDLTKTLASMDLYSARKTSDGQVLDGATTYIEFPGFSYKSELNGNVDFNIIAKACYKYSNKAVVKMCVRKNLLDASLDPGNGCVVKGDKEVQNSGGPVHITNLKQFPTGNDKISFTFTIEKVGSGNIFKLDNYPNCEDSIERRDKVYLKIDTGIDGLTCDALETGQGTPSKTNEGYVSLYQGKRTITCVQRIPTPLDYEKIVTFELSYLYENEITKKITVKHPLS